MELAGAAGLHHRDDDPQNGQTNYAGHQNQIASHVAPLTVELTPSGRGVLTFPTCAVMLSIWGISLPHMAQK